MNPQTTGSAGVQAANWGARARDWADFQEPTERAIFHAVLTAAKVRAGQDILDVGCGSGLAAHMAFERGARVSGFDATPDFIEIARGRTPAGDFRVGEMEHLPYEDESFDVVIAVNSVQYAAEPANAVREAARVMRSDGVLAIAVWGPAEACQSVSYNSSLRRILDLPPPPAAGSSGLRGGESLARLLEDASLKVEGPFTVACPFEYADEETAVKALQSPGNMNSAVREYGEARVREAMIEALTPYRTAGGGYRLDNQFVYVLARR